VDTIKQWARIKGVEIIEEHAMPDHIHLCVSIPPKYSVARVQILNRSTVLIGLGIAYMETGRLHEVESAFNNTLRVLHSFSATELQQCAKEL
jgi:REP element-mobilizing transposase RayT